MRGKVNVDKQEKLQTTNNQEISMFIGKKVGKHRHVGPSCMHPANLRGRGEFVSFHKGEKGERMADGEPNLIVHKHTSDQKQVKYLYVG